MSISSEINRLQMAKSDIASAIEEKGVTVSEDTKLDGMAALISAIQAESDTSFVRTRTVIEANATSVTIPRNEGDSAVYDDTSFLLYYNGLLLSPNDHYTVNSAGDTIELTFEATSGDEFDFIMQRDLSIMIADLTEATY